MRLLNNLSLSKNSWYGLLIYLLAVSLRLYRLGSQGMFFDEAHSWLSSQFPTTDLITVIGYSNHVPLYYLLLKLYFFVVPQTAIGIRFFSVVFSFLSLLVLMRLTNRWWGPQAALFAGWVAALSSFELYYAQDARMYTFLSFLWLSACMLLLEAWHHKPILLLPWGLCLAAMAQTHVHGLVFAAVHLALWAGLWGYELWVERLAVHASKLVNRWGLIGCGIALAGMLPVVIGLLNSTAWQTFGGGAWIPTLRDIGMLFVLSTVGLTGGRSAFLDADHLVLPGLSAIPLAAWGVVGLLLFGPLVILGCLQAWKKIPSHRLVLSSMLFLILMPIVVVWGLGSVFHRMSWAYKPFLGPAFLLYVFAGIGFSYIPSAWLRKGFIGLALVVSVFSLIPYYTIWYKDSSKDAFSSLPQYKQGGVIIIEPAYKSSLAYFYLGKDAPIIGINPAQDSPPFLDTRFGVGYLYGYESLTCEAVLLSRPANVWVYGDESKVRAQFDTWSDCLGDTPIWIYKDHVWQPTDF